MSVINRFHKVIICILTICFVCVVVGSIDTIRTQTVGVTNNSNISILIGFAFCLLCFLLICKSFRWLDGLNDKECLWVSLLILALVTGILMVISFSARVTQFADSTDVMDTAFYLRKHAEVTEELPYIIYIESFGNNYPIILFESFLMKMLDGMGFQDVGIILNHLNVVVILAAIVLTWLIVKETSGIRAATKTAILCLLNPYLYLIVNWTYSMTYSLPIMMGILYVALRLKKTNKTSIGIILALLEGLLIGGGFLIRPTTVFPLIAVAIIWFPSFIKKNIRIIRRIAQLGCVLFTVILVVMLVNVQVSKRFGNIRSKNMPLSFWTMMGSHENGIWNGKDFNSVLTVQNQEDKVGFTLDQTISNYKEQGIDGTLNLWYRKLNQTWDDGGFFNSGPTISEGNALSEYIWTSGARNQLTKVYCQAFRLFMIIGFLLTCMIALGKRNIPEIVLIMIITIFGCTVFHTFWETNPRYSIPFILPMLITVAYGLSSGQELIDRKITVSRAYKRMLGIVLMGILMVMCSNLNTALKENKTLYFYRIYSTGHTRVCAEIEPENFGKLEQDFYTKKPFNSLFIKATIPAKKTKEDCSGYELCILNDEGKVLSRTGLLPDGIGKNGITVSFDTVSGFDHYLIRLEKRESGKESIRFYTHYTYEVDSYRGMLTTDGREGYPSDLLMDVYESQKTTIFSKKARIMIIMVILIAGVFIAFVPVNRKNCKCL